MSTSLLTNGDLIDEIETYDFKLRTKTGKLDIRVKFAAKKPEVVAVKKAEYKVAIFDVLCLSRYVMKLSHYTCVNSKNLYFVDATI